MLPLSTVKLLDLTVGNPYVSSMFADYGAEVIKVESPIHGDPVRARGGKGYEGVYHAYYGRNKKSLAIDYTQPAGSEIIRRLAANVDVVCFNVAEEKLTAYGLGYEDLKAVNPKLVYGVLTPFGESGPWKDYPDYDLIIMSRAGLQEKTGFAEKPTRIGFPLGYIFSSWHLVGGMLAAYLRAQESGVGQKVSVSAWQCMMALDDTYAQCLLGMNELPKRIGNGFPTTNPTDTFKCKDGWFSLSIGSDQQWWAFSKAAGMPMWAEDPRYSHDPVRSMENYFGDLDQQLRDYFSTITIAEADRICREAMVPGGPCNTVKELVNDAQVADRNMILTHQDPIFGAMRQLGKAAKFTGDTDADFVFSPAPLVGQDNESIFKQLQVTDAEVDELQRGGVIA